MGEDDGKNVALVEDKTIYVHFQCIAFGLCETSVSGYFSQQTCTSHYGNSGMRYKLSECNFTS